MTRTLFRLGWTSLAFWSLAGLLLETAHGLKWPPLFVSELTHLLLRLAHAHGVGLGLVVLVLAQTGSSIFGARARAFGWVSRLIGFAAVAMPVGFATGTVGASEADPGFAIFLVPVGGLALFVGLAWVAATVWRDQAPPPR